MRATFALIPLVTIGMLLAVGCGEARETNPERLVPAGANLIGKVQVAQILEDKDFATLFAAVPKDEDDPQTLDELLAQVPEEIGIDLRQFSSAVFFGDLARIDEYLAVIARASFEEEELVAAIEKSREATLTTALYKGRSVHTDADGDIAFSVLGSDTLVLGTPDAVRAVIDVQQGDVERASGRVYSEFGDLGDGIIRIALELPPEVAKQAEEFSGGLPFGFGQISLAALKDAEVVGIAVDKDGTSIRVDARVDFTTEASATEVSEVVDGLLKVLAGLSPDEEIKALFRKVQVSRDNTRLKVRFEATISELEGLVSGLEDGFPGQVFGAEEQRGEAVIVERSAPVPVPVEETSEDPRRGHVTAIVPGIGTPVAVTGAEHILVGAIAVYSTVPPTSGPHWPATAQCGVHADELPDELIVHNMEHGHVVISYNLPDPQEARALVEVVQRLPGLRDFESWGILRPYPNIEPGTVAMTAWGVMEVMKGGNKQGIESFNQAYRGNRLSAETRERGPIPCR